MNKKIMVGLIVISILIVGAGFFFFQDSNTILKLDRLNQLSITQDAILDVTRDGDNIILSYNGIRNITLSPLFFYNGNNYTMSEAKVLVPSLNFSADLIDISDSFGNYTNINLSVSGIPANLVGRWNLSLSITELTNINVENVTREGKVIKFYNQAQLDMSDIVKGYSIDLLDKRTALISDINCTECGFNMKFLNRPEKYIELLVKSDDNIPSKIPREDWTQDIIDEERRGSWKQGQIVAYKDEGWDWGNLERDPKRFAIVKVPAHLFNESWVEGDNTTRRFYSLELRKFMSERDYDEWENIPYNDNTSRDEIKSVMNFPANNVEPFDFDNRPNDTILHGSSGNFTICPSGCNYTSLAGFESGEQADLTGTGPAIATITEGFTDTTAVDFNGWTTTASDYIQVITNGTARHNGVWNDSTYIIDVNAVVIRNRENFVRLDGLQITFGSSFDIGIYNTVAGTSADILVTDTIIKASGAGTGQTGILTADGGGLGNITIRNSLIYDIVNGNSQGIVNNEGSFTTSVENSLVYNISTNGMRENQGTLNVINSISFGNNDDFVISNGVINYSASDDGDGDNAVIINETRDFLNVTLKNFNLKTGSHLINNGTTIASFDTDIIGTIRPQGSAWDIGAFEFIFGVTDNEYPIFSNYLDNNATLIDSGIGWFNVTVINTNGTVILEIDNTNITASNLTSTTFNASYTFSSPGVYPYRWHSWGNGTNENYNVSNEQSYTVTASIPINISFVSPTPPNDTTTSNTSIIINVSLLNATNLNNVIFNWNDTNTSFYDDSLVLMFNFNNVSSLGENDSLVVDVSKDSNNGTVVGATWNATGRYGGAYEFDADEDYIDFNYTLDNNNSGTMCAWYKPNGGWASNGDGTDSFIVDISDGTIASRALLYLNDNGARRFILTNGSNTLIIQTSQLNWSEQWYFSCGVYNSTFIALYNEGELVNSENWHATMPNKPSLNAVGKATAESSVNKYFNGSIDEVRIWNRSLSADEVQQQYMSNLNKYDPDKWLLYVNQSKNSTAGLDDGVYTYQAFSKDDDWYQTEERIITISAAIDNEYPIFYNYINNPLNGSIYNFGQNYRYNVSINSTNGSVGLEFNNVNYSSSNLSNIFNSSIGELSAGNYNYYWWGYGNGTSNLYNISNLQSYTLNQAIPEGTLTNTQSWTIEYPLEVTIGLTESNLGDGDLTYVVYRDDVNYGTGETITLGAASYNYVLNTTGGTNYTANASMDVQTLLVNQNSSLLLALSVLPSTSETFGTETNVTGSDCPGELTCNLYREGSLVSNSDIQTLGAGVYNYTYNTTGNNNYSITSISSILTITQASPICALISNSAQEYPNPINVSGSCTNPEDTAILRRDGSDVTGENSQNVVLGAGVYSYNISTIQTQNYTAASNTTSVTVNQNTSWIIALDIAPSTSEIYGTTTTATGSGCPAQISCGLFRDGASVSNPEVEILGVAVYNYTYNTTGNINYSAETISDLLTINQNTSVIYTYLNHSRSNISIINGTSIWLNATLQTGVGDIQLYNNGTLINSGSSPLSNLTAFNDAGLYNITAIYPGNNNFTSSFETWWVNVSAIIDDEYPIFSNYYDNNATLVDSGIALFNVTLTNTNGTVFLEIDGANYTAQNLTANVYNVSVNISVPGNYNYYWGSWGNGSLTNYNTSGIRSYTINTTDFVYPVFSSSTQNPANNSEYGVGANYEFNITITDINGTSGIEFNGINYSISNLSSLFNWTTNDLSAGNYNYYWWAYGNGTENNYNTSIIYDYTIAQNSTYQLLLSGTTPITFGTASDFEGTNCPSQLTCNLFRNDTAGAISNPDTTVLGAGIYNYTYNTTGNTNYTVKSNSSLLTVNQATQSITPLLNGVNDNLIVTYPQQINASYTGTNQTAVTIDINGTGINIAQNYTWGAGGWVVNYSMPSNQNYSGFETYLNLTINQAVSIINLTLNNSQSNITINQGDTIDLNCSTITGEGSAFLILYKEGSIINNGTSPIGNTTTFDTFQIENITCMYQDSQNYSTSAQTFWVNVTEVDFEFPIFSNPTETPTEPVTYSFGADYEFNITITSTNATAGLEFNGINYSAQNLTSTLFNATISNLGAQNYTYYWWSYGNGTFNNYNISATYSYNITKAIPQGSVAGTSPITFGTAGDVQGTETNNGDGDVTYQLFRDNVLVSNPDTTTLGVGSYNYIYNATSGQNYSANSSIGTFSLTVNQATSEVNLTLNNTESNITIDQGNTILLNGTLITGDATGTLRLYNNGSLINEGTIEVSNNTLFNTPGLFNITVIYISSQNYSQSFETYYVNVIEVSAPTISIVSPANNTNTSNNQLDINYTVTNEQACWYSNDSMTLNITLASCTNITTITWSEGVHNVTVWVNNSVGVEESDSVTFNIDAISPIVSLVSPANNSEETISNTINFIYNVTDTASISSCSLILDGIINLTDSSIAKNVNQSFTQTLINGNYDWNINCTDSLNVGTSEIFNLSVNVFIDNEYPQFSNYYDNNGTLLDSGIALFNTTVINTNGTVFLEINGVNYTAQNLTSNVYNVSVNFTSPGTWNYYWGSWGNGTDENYNTSGLRSYTVNSSALPPQSEGLLTFRDKDNGNLFDRMCFDLAGGKLCLNDIIADTLWETVLGVVQLKTPGNVKIDGNLEVTGNLSVDTIQNNNGAWSSNATCPFIVQNSTGAVVHTICN